jgi:hypothetical protein
MNRRALKIGLVDEPKPQQDTPERFAKLTRHLSINGQKMESVLHKLEREKQDRQS